MTEYSDEGLTRIGLLGAVCIIFGLTVILFPNLLVWIVGLFLVIQGALLLTDYLEMQRPRTTAPPPKGVYCHNCGTKNLGEAVYCKKCGKKLTQARQVVTAEPQEVVEQIQN